MVRILKLLVVTALAAVLVVGLTTTACCDGTDGNGGVPNGDAPNGDEPNGDVTNGDEPNDGEPDLTSGFGIITSAEEYGGTGFQDKDPAPDFTFEDASGQSFSLSDFQGRLVIINFWRTDCGWCVYEMPYLEQVYNEWPADELIVLTIDIGEDAAKVSDFLDDIEVSLPVILDREALVTAQYRVSSLPRTVFINKEGLIRYIQFGAFQSLEELEYILEQLIAL